ncbi:MAG TPA: precorrin isomerase [Syntrophomonadaceae bacterium]|nr:precorrin isomerase [Syntrophomonadaceae bacterium]
MKRGVLILGHGSRRQAANEGLKRLAMMVQASLSMQAVPTYFQFSRPSLDDGVASYVNDGIKEIIIVPTLLFPGIHLKEDIPEALEKLKQQYGSEVRFHLTPAIGPDPRLAEIIMERVQSAVESSPQNDSEAASYSTICNPDEITRLSRTRIEDALGENFFRERFPGPAGEVVRRVVHATGSPDVARLMRFHPQAVDSGLAALKKGAQLFTDVRMVKVGINRAALRELGGKTVCLIHHPKVREEAEATGLTRAIVAVRACSESLPGNIVVVGNAPTALEEVINLVEQGIRPALIIGTPVGFVGAAESKARLLGQEVPFITMIGPQGGSSVAVSVVNALLALARGDAGL